MRRSGRASPRHRWPLCRVRSPSLPSRIDGCPHCELDAAKRGLRAAPLRELTGNDLGVYPFKAMTTFGEVDERGRRARSTSEVDERGHDFRHFLPRIAELLSLDGYVHACDLSVLGGS